MDCIGRITKYVISLCRCMLVDFIGCITRLKSLYGCDVGLTELVSHQYTQIAHGIRIGLTNKICDERVMNYRICYFHKLLLLL